MSHEVVTNFLWQKRFMPCEVWQLVKDRIDDSPDAFLVVDDSVHDKRYSRFIELVRAQYSGNEPRVVRGMGVVSLVHSRGKEEDFYPIDYRGYAPDVDGKTKNDPCHEMFVNAADQQQLKARTSLCDGWYASADNLQLIHRRLERLQKAGYAWERRAQEGNRSRGGQAPKPAKNGLSRRGTI